MWKKDVVAWGILIGGGCYDRRPCTWAVLLLLENIMIGSSGGHYDRRTRARADLTILAESVSERW